MKAVGTGEALLRPYRVVCNGAMMCMIPQNTLPALQMLMVSKD